MSDTSFFGSGFGFGGNNSDADTGQNGTDVLPSGGPQQTPEQGPTFGSALNGFGNAIRSAMPGPHYRAPDPQASPLDQTADFLQQRIKRANEVAANPLLQFFAPEGVQAARNFVPQATEKLQQIRTQQATMQANRTQAQTLGLSPGEVPDEADMAARVEVARQKALQGNLQVFRGLQAVDPKTAEAIAPQVHEVAASHLDKAQFAFDSLAGMQNQGQYRAKLAELQKDGTLTDLMALGLKVPPTYGEFQNTKAGEGQALREARIGIDTVRQKLEERNTYQPMEKKEAETYNGRLTTAFGDQITNGTWGRNGASGVRGLIVNGAADPRTLGKNFTLATPEQRKAIKEEFDGTVSKEDLEKYRSNNRTYQLATTDGKGKPLEEGKINTNPNVQQGIAEGLASMLRGGSGGANVGLLKIELAKRGWAQGAIDGLLSNYAGLVNMPGGKESRAYISALTQRQQREVLDALKTYNDQNINDRVANVARRAGALGLDAGALGLGTKETAGAIADAIEEGRQAQINRMMPNSQAIGGGDGVLQLGAQRPGTGATALPPGTQGAVQMPGSQPLQTPVQQAQNPQVPPQAVSQPAAPTPPGAQTSTPSAPGGTPAIDTPAGAGVKPTTVAGVQVAAAMPNGVSPDYITKAQRIETGNEKSPWTAGNSMSSAGGAFQFIKSTWAANKPPGAPDDVRKATPAQQAEGFANLTAKNAEALTRAGLPVNDTTAYMAHNVGAGGASALLRAAPNADARTVVGEAAAKNNPMFFKGRPTVAQVLQRYETEVNKTGVPASATTSIWDRMSGRKPGEFVTVPGEGIQGDRIATPEERANSPVTENLPAIGSTVGGIAGGAAGPLGGIAGGAAGGAAGQVLKDYLKGNEQNPAEIAKEGALGGVLGVGSQARPILSAIARATGAGAVEGGAEALKGAEAADTIDAGLKGLGAGVGGELFGRALGMAGHRLYKMFAPDAQKAVQSAAKSYSEAVDKMATESPRLPAVNGAAGGPNPAYTAAEGAKTKAERTLVEAGLNPEEAAYAHRVSVEGVPRQEAEIMRPGTLEKQNIGQGYQQLENEVGQTGIGAPKAAPKLSDGPLAAADNAKMAPAMQRAAERTEMAITAPAANWQEKWTQLKDARSALLELERDALSSTTAGRTQQAADYRTLANSVRVQQEKAAKYVFGEEAGAEFIKRLNVLDTRYARLMDATNGGDLLKAAKLKGEAGREADRKFRAFAQNDPVALRAWNAARGARGDVAEATVPWTVAAEGLPGIGKVVKLGKLMTILQDWARERAAGAPVSFSDFIKPDKTVPRTIRNIAGTTAQRLAVQGDVLNGATQ